MTYTFAFQVVYIVHPQFTKQLKLQWERKKEKKNATPNYNNLIPRYRHFIEHMIFIQLVKTFYTFENRKDHLRKFG
jgi:hypothetical protein